MKKSTVYIFIAIIGLVACGQNNTSTPQTTATETYHSVRNYVYADAKGNRLTIHNSLPKGGMKYTDPNGVVYSYVGFWTQLKNETADPIEMNIDVPLDSFTFPSSSGRYIKFLVPADTMTVEKASLFDYGLNVKSFLDDHRFEAASFKSVIHPNDSTAFHVLILSKWNPIAGGNGGMRAGLVLKGQALMYRIAGYTLTRDLPLTDIKEIGFGSLHVKNLTLQQ